MRSTRKTDPFKKQMAQSMAELKSILTAGSSPTDNGRLTIRTYNVAEPADYNASAIKKVRSTLNVSQAVFAKMVGVSDVLVRSWENGARSPAPVARRLLDQIREYPERFTSLVQPLKSERRFHRAGRRKSA